MIVIDCGKNTATIYNSDKDICKTISHMDVLRLPEELDSGTVVVAEYAHLGCPRQKYSLSQPYLVYKERPIKTKYCDFENVVTFPFSELPPEKHKEMENLIQCYYINSVNVLNIITKENLKSYFTGYNDPVYVSFYNEKTINNDFHPIGFISSRPVEIFINDFIYKIYYHIFT